MTKQGGMSEDGVPYTFRVSMIKGPPKAIQFRVPEGTSPYPECNCIIGDIWARNIDRAELLDWHGKILMFYVPWRGWFFGDERDSVFR